MFPYGLPAQFSFVSTFRMKSKTRKDVWDLLRIEDFLGELQFAVRLHGEDRTVEVLLMDYKGDIQTVVFDNNKNTRRVSDVISRSNAVWVIMLLCGAYIRV